MIEVSADHFTLLKKKLVCERGKVISEGVSIFKSENYAEIDIITDLNYRGKGLGSISNSGGFSYVTKGAVK